LAEWHKKFVSGLAHINPLIRKGSATNLINPTCYLHYTAPYWQEFH